MDACCPFCSQCLDRHTICIDAPCSLLSIATCYRCPADLAPRTFLRRFSAGPSTLLGQPPRASLVGWRRPPYGMPGPQSLCPWRPGSAGSSLLARPRHGTHTRPYSILLHIAHIIEEGQPRKVRGVQPSRAPLGPAFAVGGGRLLPAPAAASAPPLQPTAPAVLQADTHTPGLQRHTGPAKSVASGQRTATSRGLQAGRGAQASGPLSCATVLYLGATPAPLWRGPQQRSGSCLGATQQEPQERRQSSTAEPSPRPCPGLRGPDTSPTRESPCGR